MENIGSQLREAREQRELSIPDVAHETRISATQLRALEENDYSAFASLTYGRYFLALYSEFLDVDTGDFQKQFPEARLGSIENYGYLQDSDETLPAKRAAADGQRTKRSEKGKKRRNRDRAPADERSLRSNPGAVEAEIGGVPRSHPVLFFGLLLLLGGAIYYFFFLESSDKDPSIAAAGADEAEPKGSAPVKAAGVPGTTVEEPVREPAPRVEGRGPVAGPPATPSVPRPDPDLEPPPRARPVEEKPDDPPPPAKPVIPTFEEALAGTSPSSSTTTDPGPAERPPRAVPLESGPAPAPPSSPEPEIPRATPVPRG